MEDTFHSPAFRAALFYQDPAAALVWLEKAFGFERRMAIWSQDGQLVHAEMQFGDSRIMLGSGWADFTASPASIQGKNTQIIHVHLQDGLEAHYKRAIAAGAVSRQAPAEQFYGDRSYRVSDLEGHLWTFGQTVRHVSREEAEQASGLRIEAWY